MMLQAPLSYRLINNRRDLFDEIKENILQRKRIEYSLNILIGLVEVSLPLYFLNDIPEQSRLWAERENLKKEALKFIDKNFSLFLELLSESETIFIREKLLYLLGKSAKELTLEPKKYIEMALVVLAVLIKNSGQSKLAKQLLCRYDFGCLLLKAGYGECGEKVPYKEVIDKINNWRDDDEYKKYYIALSQYMFLDKKVDISEAKKKIEKIIKNLPVADEYFQILQIIEQCLNRKQISFTETRSETLTVNIIHKE